MSSGESTTQELTLSEKCKKYDRQLRLWGDHGQRSLEMAKICLINATTTGTETLKNLILPGIGLFTIVDNKTVSGADVGNNFFLDKESIGKSRAKITTDLLAELNQDVMGDFIEESVENLLANNPVFFVGFNVVIATDVPEKILLQLADTLWQYNIPLVIVRSYGFIGYLRVVLKEHTVIESHPDNVIEDLRLDRPFPALINYCNSLDLDKMSKKDHMHTPWLVIVYKFLEKWKNEHGVELPKTYNDKKLLKEMISNGLYKSDDDIPEEEENFDEAIRNVNTALSITKICDEVQNILADKNSENLTMDTKPFWILVAAVKEFIRNEGQGALPLRGSIPDMTSDSERYILLQNAYREQADKDVAAVTGHVQRILQSIGLDEPLPLSNKPRSVPSSPAQSAQDIISESDIAMFCKNVNFLRVVKSRSLQEEYQNTSAKLVHLTGSILEDSSDDDAIFYIMLRAVDRFYAEYNRYPGVDKDSRESDVPKLKACLTKLMGEWSMTQAIKDDYVDEMCRYGACELHSISAFMGGVSAQEVIKVITRQFVPINNTFIYNAIRQTTVTLEL